MPPTSALYTSIHTQPDILGALINSPPPALGEATSVLSSAQRIIIAGTGSSSHAALIGEHLFRAAGLEALATTSFDLATYPRRLSPEDAVIGLSHTGETRYGRDVLNLAKEAGARTIGITGEGSQMTGAEIVLQVSPRERSDTYTVSYTASLVALALLAIRAGERLGKDTSTLQHALSHVPEHVSSMLAREPDAVEVARYLSGVGRRITLAGAGPNFATAREGALKLKESAYITAEGFELETLLHGGLQAIELHDSSVIIVGGHRALARSIDALQALMIITGPRVLAIAVDSVVSQIPDGVFTIPMPDVPESLSPILAVIPLQLIAAHTADMLEFNPDNFRFDEPRYKAAIESLTL